MVPSPSDNHIPPTPSSNPGSWSNIILPHEEAVPQERLRQLAQAKGLSLPPILDPTLKQVVRHYVRAPGHTPVELTLFNEFQVVEGLGDTVANYFCGQAVYRLLTSEKWASPKSSHAFATFRAVFQTNKVFAQIALLYDLHTTAVPPVSPCSYCITDYSPTNLKHLGDCFEAYVGAMSAEGQHEELARWLNPLMDIVAEEISPRVQRFLEGSLRTTRVQRNEAAASPVPTLHSLEQEDRRRGRNDRARITHMASVLRIPSPVFTTREDNSHVSTLQVGDLVTVSFRARTKKVAEAGAARLACDALRDAGLADRVLHLDEQYVQQKRERKRQRED